MDVPTFLGLIIIAILRGGLFPTAATQLRNLDREFRAGRIGLEEDCRIKKVLVPESE